MRAANPPMSRPLIIAHRGASGYLPEHTLVSKALAFGMGADYLEQDVVATRDGELIVFHDLVLERITDVHERFPGRARADGHFYCVDFTLEELRTLRVGARRGSTGAGLRYPQRFPDEGGKFPIQTLSEEIRFIQGLSRSTGRAVGIYPEIKEPAWHRQHGIDIAERMLAMLDEAGYRTPEDAAFVQCFDVNELKRLRQQFGCRLRLVQLIERQQMPSLERSHLEQIALYAEAIGPALGLIYQGRNPGTAELVVTSLVDDAHAAGLAVHPYTLRKDDLPEGIDDFTALLELLLHRVGVDGVFTDFPDLMVDFLNAQGGNSG